MVLLSPERRAEIESLYALHAALIDEGPLTDWPQLFTQDAIVKIVTRENLERGWPLALVLCEGRAAIEDRVTAIGELMMTIPRRTRHVISGFRITQEGEDAFAVRANFAVFETLPARPTEVYASGLYDDRIIRSDGALRFAQKIAVCDGELISTSLVLPL
jgi:anthranilate 1,2-dioxygenase small subunit